MWTTRPLSYATVDIEGGPLYFNFFHIQRADCEKSEIQETYPFRSFEYLARSEERINKNRKLAVVYIASQRRSSFACSALYAALAPKLFQRRQKLAAAPHVPTAPPGRLTRRPRRGAQPRGAQRHNMRLSVAPLYIQFRCLLYTVRFRRTTEKKACSTHSI